MVVHSFWWNFKFSNDRERPLTTIWKLGFTFQAENFHLPWLGSSSFQNGMHELYVSWYIYIYIYIHTLQFNCPAKRMVHQWIPHWTASDQSESSLVNQTRRSIFLLQFSSPFSMCTLGATSPSKMYLSYMRLCTVQQFIIFVRNVSL